MNSSSDSRVLSAKDSRGGSQAYALLIAVTAAVGGLLFGYDTSVISGAILFVRRLFHLSSTQTEFAVSIVLAGQHSEPQLPGTSQTGSGGSRSWL